MTKQGGKMDKIQKDNKKIKNLKVFDKAINSAFVLSQVCFITGGVVLFSNNSFDYLPNGAEKIVLLGSGVAMAASYISSAAGVILDKKESMTETEEKKKKALKKSKI